ncbi:hypothetical protein [Nocardioides sp.]|uniref:hypothetical protein n=1 Tax=Nocardioides sp. TaxID=35761 RepID=UPI0037849B08
MTDDEQVCRLLAEARHEDPIPPDVAARLDGVLADLRSDRPVPSSVADLAAARRRRRAGVLLAAAAAVVVAGVGVGWLRGLGAQGGDSGGSTADSAVVGSAPEAADGGGSSTSGRTPDLSRAVPIDPARFARDVARLQGVSDAALQDQGARSDLATVPLPDGCVVPGPGRLVAVRYAGSLGALVYRPVRGDTQVVDLYLCGHESPARSVTLPAP